MTLTEFLLARIAEDEAVARAVLWPHFVSWVEGRDGSAGDDALLLYENVEGFTADKDVYGWPDVETQDHVARFDPARVLAECEAKRRIVEIHSGPELGWEDLHLCWDSMTADYECETLLALVAVYADHPDYDEAWRP